LPEDEAYDSVAGFLLAKMHKMPKVGEEFLYRGLRFVVKNVSNKVIDLVGVKEVWGGKKKKKKKVKKK